MAYRENDLMPSVIRRVSEPVFHYTSATGLLGIVESRCVWASAAAGLNDKAEIRQGWSKINAWLKAQKQTHEIETLVDYAEAPFQDTHDVFVLSGSTAGDDANQWRLYADRGKGYAIEFDPTIDLAAVTEAPAPRRPRPGHSMIFGAAGGDIVTLTPWFHVLYSDETIDRALSEIVRSMKRATKHISASAVDEQDFDLRREEMRNDATEALETVAHLIKASGFAGENEVRVVTAFLFASEHVKYRAGPYGIVGYATLTAAPPGHRGLSVVRTSGSTRIRPSLPVRSVRMGPLLDDDHESAVRAFLEANGLSGRMMAVTRSAVPLR